MYDVIEHVTNPKIILRKLANSLRKEGYLIITHIKSEEREDYPMHFSIRFNVEEYLHSLGLLKEKEWLYVKRGL
jgi:2-polyprenyl-3-methyl-5-hydroxy-6-metoxy-1,4-benzoquinol methylase